MNPTPTAPVAREIPPALQTYINALNAYKNYKQSLTPEKGHVSGGEALLPTGGMGSSGTLAVAGTPLASNPYATALLSQGLLAGVKGTDLSMGDLRHMLPQEKRDRVEAGLWDYGRNESPSPVTAQGRISSPSGMSPNREPALGTSRYKVEISPPSPLSQPVSLTEASYSPAQDVKLAQDNVLLARVKDLPVQSAIQATGRSSFLTADQPQAVPPAAAPASQTEKVLPRLKGNETLPLSGQKRNSVPLGLVPTVKTRAGHSATVGKGKTGKIVTSILPEETGQKKQDGKPSMKLDEVYINGVKVEIEDDVYHLKYMDKTQSTEKNPPPQHNKDGSLAYIPNRKYYHYDDPIPDSNYYDKKSVFQDTIDPRIVVNKGDKRWAPTLTGLPRHRVNNYLLSSDNKINLDRLTRAVLEQESSGDNLASFPENKSRLSTHKYHPGTTIRGATQNNFYTAEEFGIKDIKDLSDYDKSYNLTKHQLAYYLEQFNGNLEVALRAFHDGYPGMVNFMNDHPKDWHEALKSRYKNEERNDEAKSYLRNVMGHYNDDGVSAGWGIVAQVASRDLVTHSLPYYNPDTGVYSSSSEHIDELKRAAPP
ncbi:hypothetical protein PT277_05250 [Acetobacteraceae bacterium ESL0709]|nr:hypothetical protein [Acetobacteraceae bacterium ESL0697]MDF7678102.1 hypothetical protein [Acetobacteraceae bacterium ESL0709]